MISNDKLLSAIDSLQRRLVVGDEIQHRVHGAGVLVAGWEGHLEVRFPSVQTVFTDLDGYCLIPSDLKGPWLLLPRNEAKVWIDGYNHQRSLAFVEIKSAFQRNFLNADQLFSEKLSSYLTQDEYEREKVVFIQSWVKNSIPVIKGEEPRIPDGEQAVAIAAHGAHIQVVARAGSGKVIHPKTHLSEK